MSTKKQPGAGQGGENTSTLESGTNKMPHFELHKRWQDKLVFMASSDGCNCTALALRGDDGAIITLLPRDFVVQKKKLLCDGNYSLVPVAFVDGRNSLLIGLNADH